MTDDGKLHLKALVPTVKEARGVIAAKGETAYLIDPVEGRILKMTHKSPSQLVSPAETGLRATLIRTDCAITRASNRW